MAQPSGHVSYDPLPLTGEDHSSNGLYNAPPSPGPQFSSFDNNSHMQLHDESIPHGAAQPRFMAANLYDTSNAPGFRDSYASSHQTLPGGPSSEYGSVYALNDTRGSYRDDPRDVYQEHVPMSPVGHSRALTEKNAVYAAPKAKSRRALMIVGAIIALLLIAAAVIVPLYFTVIKPKSAGGQGTTDSDSTTGTARPSATATATPKENIVTGVDGSVITMDDGTTFTYQNKFGGYWYYDPNDPYGAGGKAQSWTPAVNETFSYGINSINGVNIGGWLNTEPFISPALYQKYLTNPTPAVDEWTLSQAMTADTAGGGLSQLETHYKTFITEKDFADIAGAGLNYVRIPIGFWAIDARADEPYLADVSWTYFLKAIKWARKYGLRINLDLHSVPGSQNGWNHSGRLGTIGFLNGPMGYANAQRSLNVIRSLAEFISQPQYKDVVPMFGILNEPQGSIMGQTQLTAFYLEAYNIVRTAGGGTGSSNGVWLSIHDGFFPRSSWAGVLPNADRVALDSHPYLCFNGQSANPISSYATTPCTSWGSVVNTSMSAFGLTTAGEFSNAVTDCGLFLNGVNLGTRYEGTYPGSGPSVGSCDPWTDWTSYDDPTKQAIKQFALASMDALQNYFFWTWKIGNSSTSGVVETPAWSYQLGLQQGWMPIDPREAVGTCGNTSPWQPPLASWQTGGAGAGSIPASATNNFAWPPAQISNAGPIASLPSYTPTGSIITLTASAVVPASTEHVTKTADPGDGWNNAQDTQAAWVEITGCTYLDPWVDPGTALPPVCAAAAARRQLPRFPVPTPPPA